MNAFRWRVRLEGRDADLRILCQSLRSSSISVLNEDGSYFLATDEFELLVHAADVHSIATALLPQINGIGRWRRTGFHQVRIGEVVEVSVDGSRHTTHMVAAEFGVVIGGRVNITVGLTAGQVSAPTKPSPQIAFELSLRDSAVRKALRLWGTNQSDWVNLYRILEVIRHDVKSMPSVSMETLALKSEIRRFTHTADNPEAVGDDARHGVSVYDPPKNPMTPQDARAFMQRVFERWIRAKADLEDA